MIASLASQVRVFLYRHPTDLRKSFNGLVALTESQIRQDPLSGSLFVFLNRRQDRIKILYWGQSGYCIWYQQLERGTYQLPKAGELDSAESIELSHGQLSLILDGIDLASVRQRKRFRLERQGVPTAVA